MVSEVRLYIEGGRLTKSKEALRKGFRQFLSKGITNKEKTLRLILGGSNEETRRLFEADIIDFPEAICLLLVDAESKVEGSPKKHLGLDSSAIPEDQIHLMVQLMEAWIIADLHALREYYKAHKHEFLENKIPKDTNVERIEKKEVLKALKEATKKIQKGKRVYDKTRDAPKLLEILNPSTVKERACHCKRLLETLDEKLGQVE